MKKTILIAGVKINVFDAKTWLVVTLIIFLVYYYLGLISIV